MDYKHSYTTYMCMLLILCTGPKVRERGVIVPTLHSSNTIPQTGNTYSLGRPGWSGGSCTMPMHDTMFLH